VKQDFDWDRIDRAAQRSKREHAFELRHPHLAALRDDFRSAVQYAAKNHPRFLAFYIAATFAAFTMAGLATYKTFFDDRPPQPQQIQLNCRETSSGSNTRTFFCEAPR
jgi:hypothetical protein